MVSKQKKVITYQRVAILLVFGIVGFVTINLGGSIKGFWNRIFHTPSLLKTHVFVQLDNLSLVEQEKKGFSGLSQKVTSIEGNEIFLYLATEYGNLIMITDYTHDPWSSREYLIEHPVEVFLGFRDLQGNFVEAEQGGLEGKKSVIKCVNKSGQIVYF